MTLYGMSSPNVIKILIMLEELGQDYRFEHVDLFSEGQFDDAFRALNPNSKVPVLEVDGEPPIFESGAILIYLAERYDRFLPASGPERYDVLKWTLLQVATVGPQLGQLNHFSNFAPSGQDYALGRYRREAQRIYSLLDERLAQSPYLAGTDYSIADIATFPWSDYLEKQGFDPSTYSSLQRWRDAIERREAVQRARASVADILTADQRCFSAGSETGRRRFMGLSEESDADA